MPARKRSKGQDGTNHRTRMLLQIQRRKQAGQGLAVWPRQRLWNSIGMGMSGENMLVVRTINKQCMYPTYPHV